MGRYVTVLYLILHILMHSSAQITGVDTLYKANDLIYFSNLERAVFTDFLEGEPDYLAMISAVDPNTEEGELQLYRDWMDEIIDNIYASGFFANLAMRSIRACSCCIPRSYDSLFAKAFTSSGAGCGIFSFVDIEVAVFAVAGRILRWCVALLLLAIIHPPLYTASLVFYL